MTPCPKCKLRPRREPGQPCTLCINKQNAEYRAKNPRKFARIGDKHLSRLAELNRPDTYER
jgi:hypothetical protein